MAAKADGNETMSDDKNFPSPKGAADRIALKGAELLDQDIYDKIARQYNDGTMVIIYGVSFHNVGTDYLAVGTQATIEGPWEVVGKGPVSRPCANVFNEAFAAMVSRQRERDLERVESKMQPPTPSPQALPVIVRNPSFIERLFGG